MLPDDAPQMGIAVLVRALHVDDGYIRIQGWHNDHILAAVRVRNAFDERVGLLKACRAGLIHGQKGEARCARLQAGNHAKMGIFLPFQFAFFDGGANDAQ